MPDKGKQVKFVSLAHGGTSWQAAFECGPWWGASQSLVCIYHIEGGGSDLIR